MSEFGETCNNFHQQQQEESSAGKSTESETLARKLAKTLKNPSGKGAIKVKLSTRVLPTVNTENKKINGVKCKRMNSPEHLGEKSGTSVLKSAQSQSNILQKTYLGENQSYTEDTFLDNNLRVSTRDNLQTKAQTDIELMQMSKDVGITALKGAQEEKTPCEAKCFLDSSCSGIGEKDDKDKRLDRGGQIGEDLILEENTDSKCINYVDNHGNLKGVKECGEGLDEEKYVDGNESEGNENGKTRGSCEKNSICCRNVTLKDAKQSRNYSREFINTERKQEKVNLDFELEASSKCETKDVFQVHDESEIVIEGNTTTNYLSTHEELPPSDKTYQCRDFQSDNHFKTCEDSLIRTSKQGERDCEKHELELLQRDVEESGDKSFIGNVNNVKGNCTKPIRNEKKTVIVENVNQEVIEEICEQREAISTFDEVKGELVDQGLGKQIMGNELEQERSIVRHSESAMKKEDFKDKECLYGEARVKNVQNDRKDSLIGADKGEVVKPAGDMKQENPLENLNLEKNSGAERRDLHIGSINDELVTEDEVCHEKDVSGVVSRKEDMEKNGKSTIEAKMGFQQRNERIGKTKRQEKNPKSVHFKQSEGETKSTDANETEKQTKRENREPLTKDKKHKSNYAHITQINSADEIGNVYVEVINNKAFQVHSSDENLSVENNGLGFSGQGKVVILGDFTGCGGSENENPVWEIAPLLSDEELTEYEYLDEPEICEVELEEIEDDMVGELPQVRMRKRSRGRLPRAGRSGGEPLTRKRAVTQSCIMGDNRGTNGSLRLSSDNDGKPRGDSDHPDARPKYYSLPPELLLHSAVMENDAESLAELLVKLKINVNQSFYEGITPLHEAASVGHIECAKVLIDHGANLSMQTDEGLTPLQAAVFTGNFECAELLIRSGASVDAIKDGFIDPDIGTKKEDKYSMNTLK